MAYLKSIPVLRCRIKRKKDASAWSVRCYTYFIFHFIVSALIGYKKENVADISDLKFTGFTYDTQTSGIQQIGDAKRFIRTTLTELWQLERRSKSDIIYWYVDFDKLKLDATCEPPKEVDVYYIPSPEDSGFKLPKSKEFEIATTAWNLMIAAKKETPFVDTTNNSNKNITPATEVDTATAQPVNP